MEYLRFCLLLIISTVVQKTSSTCGVPMTTAHKSFRTTVSSGEFPWQVSVKLGGNHICSGTIISQFWIVSMARCFPENYRERTLLIETSDIKINIAGRFYAIRKLIPLRVYTSETLDNNLVLLETSEPIQFNMLVQPACFPDDPLLPKDHLNNCKIVTWREEQGNPLFNSKVKEKLPVNLTEPCPLDVKENVTCGKIGDVPYGFTCKVDFGDPLFCQYLKTKVWILAGVVTNDILDCGTVIKLSWTANFITWMEASTIIEGKPVIPGIDKDTTQKPVVGSQELSVYTEVDTMEIPPLTFHPNSNYLRRFSEECVMCNSNLKTVTVNILLLFAILTIYSIS